jgi:small subunit ribosomal protein S6
MPLYESVFIARQDIANAQVDALADGFKAIITEAGGEVKKQEYWGLRNLAYRIKKNRKGHYVFLNLDAPAPAILEMERRMRLDEDVLRYMTLRVDELEEGSSAIMQNKGDRDGRGDRDRGDRDRGDRDRGDRRERRDSTDDAPPLAAAGDGDDAKAAAPETGADSDKDQDKGDA